MLGLVAVLVSVSSWLDGADQPVLQARNTFCILRLSNLPGTHQYNVGG